MKSTLSAAFAIATLVCLTGCQTPIIHAINVVTTAGGLPEEMVNRNVAGMVAFDEVWAGDYNLANRNNLYTQGVVSGTPEYGLRVGRVNMRHSDSFLYLRQGDKLWVAIGIIPDHLPQLRAGDIVELRQTGVTRTAENFTITGEGNIIVRVLCLASAPDYAECLKRQPKLGKFEGFGATGTDYPASVKEYGYTFTPKYDAKGKPLLTRR